VELIRTLGGAAVPRLEDARSSCDSAAAVGGCHAHAVLMEVNSYID